MNTNEEVGATSAEAESAQLAPERMQIAASQVAYWQLFQAMAGLFVAYDPAGMRASLAASLDAAAPAATAPVQDSVTSAHPPWSRPEISIQSQMLSLVQAMAAFAPTAAGLTWVPVADRSAVAAQFAVDTR